MEQTAEQKAINDEGVEQPLHHVLFTHAHGRGGEGFRLVFMTPDWPQRDKGRLSRWLQSLRPEIDRPANLIQMKSVAMGIFRLDGTLHAVLAHTDVGLEDEHGRPGLGVHALLTPVAEEGILPNFELGLMCTSGLLQLQISNKANELKEKRLGMWIPPDRSKEHRVPLELFLEFCDNEREVGMATSDYQPSVFGAIKSRDHLLDAYLTAARAGSPETPAELVHHGCSPNDLTCMSILLPPRLRLAACRWGYGLRAGHDLSIRAWRPRDDETEIVPEQDAYAAWLRRRLEGGLTEAGRNEIGFSKSHYEYGLFDDVFGNWEIRSWDELLDWIRHA